MAATIRNPENVKNYADHEVLVSTNPDAKLGRDGSISSDWFALGIEADDGKLDITRNVDEETTAGNGFGVIHTRYKPGKVEGKVSIIEDNDIIRRIMFPDAVTDSDGVVLQRHTGHVLDLVYASIFTDENGDRVVTVSKKPAKAKCPNIGRGDKAEGREIDFTFFPDGNKVIFEQYVIKGDGSVKPLDISSTRFVESVDENSPASYKFSVKGAGGGTYSVTAGPVTATGIKFDATNAVIQKALRDAGDKDIVVAGDVNAGFTVTKANGPVKVDGAGLTGSGFPKAIAVTS